MTIFQTLLLSFIVYLVLSYIFQHMLYKNLMLKKRMKTIEEYSLRRKKNKEDLKDNGELHLFLPLNLKKMLYHAGLNLKAKEFVNIWLAAITFLPLVFFLLMQSLLVSFLLFILALVFPFLYLKLKTKKRISLFNDQLGHALMIISNSLRAGFSFEQSLSSIAKDLPDPIGTEFSLIIQDLDLGRSLEDSMKDTAIRMQSKEMELLNTAVSIQRQVGGNLSQVIDNIARTIQERIKLKKKIKTLAAQGEMSGKVIAVLPLIVLILFTLINPEYMQPMYSTSYGFILLTLSLILEVLGFLFIKRITNVSVD